MSTTIPDSAALLAKVAELEARLARQEAANDVLMCRLDVQMSAMRGLCRQAGMEYPAAVGQTSPPPMASSPSRWPEYLRPVR